MQLLFQQTLRDFLAKECTPEHVRALWECEARPHDPALWQKLAELGDPGRAGARGARRARPRRARPASCLCEEAGRAALPEPVRGHGGGRRAAAARARRGAGRGVAAAAWRRATRAWPSGTPASPFVSDADVADLLLLPRDGALHAVLPDACTLVAEPANDPSRRLFSVGFDTERGRRRRRGAAARCSPALSIAARWRPPRPSSG